MYSKTYVGRQSISDFGDKLAPPKRTKSKILVHLIVMKYICI